MPRTLVIVAILIAAVFLPETSLYAETVELRYDGALLQKNRNGQETEVKTCSLLAYLTSDDAGKPSELFWLVDEKGTGWAWPESYGRVAFAAAAEKESRPPQLLHTHDNLPSPIPLPQLVFADPARRQDGKRWVEGRWQYEVGGTRKQGERTLREIVLSTNFGVSHTLHVDDRSGVLVSLQQKLFMGQGDEFQLNLQLRSEKPVDPARVEKLARTIKSLLLLQRGLGRDAGTTRAELTSEQLAVVEQSIEQIEREAENTSLQALSVEIHRDLLIQSQKKADINTLAGRFLGRKMPELKLTGLDGTPLPRETTAGKIVVLHFWKYHDEPLREPYGQVGYLDYLQNRRAKLGVQFIGVAVDPQLADEAGKRTVVRNVRKLAEFMNLSYTLTQDDGTLLKQFGDPRDKGGELPLWIVLSPAGEIVHYKVGFYEVKPEEGLAELDKVLVEQIKAKRAAEGK